MYLLGSWVVGPQRVNKKQLQIYAHKKFWKQQIFQTLNKSKCQRLSIRQQVLWMREITVQIVC